MTGFAGLMRQVLYEWGGLNMVGSDGADSTPSEDSTRSTPGPDTGPARVNAVWLSTWGIAVLGVLVTLMGLTPPGWPRAPFIPLALIWGVAAPLAWHLRGCKRRFMAALAVAAMVATLVWAVLPHATSNVASAGLQVGPATSQTPPINSASQPAGITSSASSTSTDREQRLIGSACENPPSATAPKNSTTTPGSDSIEGTIGVANVTRGDERYAGRVDASYNDVLKFEIYYNNRLLDGTTIIKNVAVGVDVPHVLGTKQVVHARIWWPGGQVLSDVEVILPEGMCLQYIPGTAVWRHNVAPLGATPKWVDDTLPDATILGAGAPIDNVRPRYDYAATVTFMARVMAAGADVNLTGATPRGPIPRTDVAVKQSDVVDVTLVIRATGNLPLTGVFARIPQGNGWTFVPRSTKAVRMNGAAISVPDSLLVPADSPEDADNGMNLDDISPGEETTLTFRVKTDANLKENQQLIVRAEIRAAGFSALSSTLRLTASAIG